MIGYRPGTLRKQFWGVLFISFLLFCNSAFPLQPKEKEYKVLFIGNSYTYINSLPQMFKAMAESLFPGTHVKVKFIGGGGATLKDHWEVGEAQKEIKAGNWNYIVLQGQSILGSDDLTDPDSPEEFYEYARKLDAEIKKHGAETIFFMTWSREHLPNEQKYLTQAYQTIAEELGSAVAPVGIVWEKLHGNSSIKLYSKDGSHPSVTGSYLSALTLIAVIFHSVPTDPPPVLYGYEILYGGKISSKITCLCNLNNECVKLLRNEVTDVMFPKGNERSSY